MVGGVEREVESGVGAGAGETWLDRGGLGNWEEDRYMAHLKLSSWVFLKKQPQDIYESVWNFKA